MCVYGACQHDRCAHDCLILIYRCPFDRGAEVRLITTANVANARKEKAMCKFVHKMRLPDKRGSCPRHSAVPPHASIDEVYEDFVESLEQMLEVEKGALKEFRRYADKLRWKKDGCCVVM